MYAMVERRVPQVLVEMAEDPEDACRAPGVALEKTNVIGVPGDVLSQLCFSNIPSSPPPPPLSHGPALRADWQARTQAGQSFAQ